MEIKITTKRPASRAAQVTALIGSDSKRPLYDERAARTHPGWTDLRRRLRGATLRSSYLAAGAAPLLYLPASAAQYWVGPERVRALAAQAWQSAFARAAETLVVPLDGPGGADAAGAVAEGIALAAYRFDKYRRQPENGNGAPAVTFVCAGSTQAAARAEVARRLALIESVNAARDLVNEPGSVATPEEFERRARELARKHHLKLTVLGAAELGKQGYEGLVTVGKGGNVPPRMIILNYQPKGARGDAHLGLLGKGLTFDTGGYSIKPSANLWRMKGDMAGGAAALYAMEAIARAAIPLRVTAVIVTAQNYVDANAMVPGDIIRGRNGKTIHVDNTDAEGRLILSDGLWRMGEEKVTHLVDAATLTGACARALGHAYSGIFGNDAFADEVAAVSTEQGEPCWRLPLVEEYMELIKTEMADVNNTGSTPAGGAITAALFLREFVPEGIHWAHIDIAGTFMAESARKYFRPGATGVMVRTFAALAERMAGSNPNF